jgi:hypothetical protein
MTRGLSIAIAALLTSAPVTVFAQAASVAPEPSIGATTDANGALDAFYTSRSQAPVWLKDDASRAAAQAFAGNLRGSAIDSLADGPALASQVEAAIARGQPADDRIIAAAWIRYVSALGGPVQGINYGDPALAVESAAPRSDSRQACGRAGAW